MTGTDLNEVLTALRLKAKDLFMDKGCSHDTSELHSVIAISTLAESKGGMAALQDLGLEKFWELNLPLFTDFAEIEVDYERGRISKEDRKAKKVMAVLRQGDRLEEYNSGKVN